MADPGSAANVNFFVQSFRGVRSAGEPADHTLGKWSAGTARLYYSGEKFRRAYITIQAKRKFRRPGLDIIQVVWTEL